MKLFTAYYYVRKGQLYHWWLPTILANYLVKRDKRKLGMVV
jgi:hypothetical protein